MGNLLNIDVKTTGFGSVIVNIMELEDLSNYTKKEKALIRKSIIEELKYYL